MNAERQRNINDAYIYLKYKYPDPPFVTPAKIRTEIETKFSLSEDEINVVYDTWKKRVLGMNTPKRKKEKEIKKESEPDKYFRPSQNLEKLKELHERYKNHEDIEELAKEVCTSEENLLKTFGYYKAKGVLHGRRIRKKKYVTISKKNFSFDEVKKTIERINKGENIKVLAKELKVEYKNLRNAYERYKNKFNDRGDKFDKHIN